VLLGLLVPIVWMVAMRWGVLERLGLRESVAERVFAAPPDREASAALMDALQQSGMNTQGIDVHVLPIAGQGGSVAILTLDAARGFDPERWFDGTGDQESLEQVFDADALRDLGVTRLAFDYVDRQGRSIVTLTAPADALSDLGDGEGDEAELLQAVMGRVDIPRLIREMAP
jgi:hypothetical protein